MEISAPLAADLKALTDALDKPGTDLETLLHALGADTRRAIDSYRGLTMTLIIDDFPITLTTMDPVDVACACRKPHPSSQPPLGALSSSWDDLALWVCASST